jgi:pyrroloquinoline-quinone synthase
MWDHLIPGLMRLRTERCPDMDLTYFTFHRELESTHEDAMKNAVAAVDGNDPQKAMTSQQRDDFRRGTKAVLDYLEGFWMGLEANRSSQAA